MAIALVANLYAKSANANDVTSAGINTTGANLIVIFRSRYQPVGIPTLTDSYGNTWTNHGELVSGSNSALRYYSCSSPVVGAGHTFTVSGVATSAPAICMLAFSGVKATSPHDTATSNTPGFATSVAPGSMTPTENNEVIVTGVSYQDQSGASEPVSVDSGFTVTNLGDIDFSSYGVAAAYKIQTTAAAVNPTWTWTATDWPVVIQAAYKAGAFAATTGTIATGTTESHIVSGGRTLILTLTDDTWVAAGGTFDGQRANIIAGLDSAQAEATGWDAVVKVGGLAVGDVVRTSATVVTITLPAVATYNITAQETITATIPASALTGNAVLVSTPTFTISTVAAGGFVSIVGRGPGMALAGKGGLVS